MVARLVDVAASWVFAALVTGLIFVPAAFGALLLYRVVDLAWPLCDRENRALQDLVGRTHVFKA